MNTDSNSSDFNIQCVTNDTLDETKKSSPYFRLYFFEKGSGIVSINDKIVSFVAPCFFSLQEEETFIVKNIEDYVLHTIVFTPSIINNSFNYNNIRSQNNNFNQSEILDLYWLNTFLHRSQSYYGMIILGPSTAMRLLELIYYINNELISRSDMYWPCRSRSFFFELLNLLNTIMNNPNKEHGFTILNDDDEMIQVIQYLTENYHHKITISDLTQYFNINRTSLAERFSAATGFSIIAFLNKIRIKLACLMLNDTTLPISEIMYRIGFEDSSHFGRIFKKETFFSPSDYRNKK